MEFRRRLDPIRELRPRSLESDAPCNTVHLATDPFDFLETEFVDFARRERGGCLRGNRSGVKLRPVRPGGSAGPLTARRHVFGDVKPAQRAIRREHLVGQRGASHGREPFPIGGGEALRKSREWRVQRIRGEIRREQRIDLRGHALDDDSRRKPDTRHRPSQPAG